MADVGGFWRPLLSLFAHMRDSGFIRTDTEVHYLVSEKIEDIVPMLKKAADFAARDGAAAQPLDNRL
jgi:predicted Rossmann-fold nucleotide-binding protein